jgi:hypothetical protein
MKENAKMKLELFVSHFLFHNESLKNYICHICNYP